MITTQGTTYLLNAGIKGATQAPTWYVFPFKGDYTPSAADVASTFPSLATESTAYSGSTRLAINFGTVVDGELDNASVLAELEATAEETWYGVGVSSVSTKGATSGTLLHVQRFPAARAMTVGSKVQLLVELDLNQP